MTIRSLFLGTLRFTVISIILAVLAAIAVVLYIQLSIIPSLPSIESLDDIRFQVPLRVYSEDKKLIGEYGKQRRIPLTIDEVPKMLRNAVVAVEDERFYQHFGVDIKGVIRAAVNLIKTRGKIEQGASTITMQLVRNLVLTRERSFIRKLKEMILATRIEEQLSKEKILELYLNRIFLGHRAYGVAAAAQVYYGRDINNLTLAEYAMIAGLPQAPSVNNPITNPKQAILRRNTVLQLMHELGYIDQVAYDDAVAQPVTAKKQRTPIEFNAPYIAEMARDYMVAQYGVEETYSRGFHVYTTINSRRQTAAENALHNALLSYDERHGYRGVLAHTDLPAQVSDEQARVLIDKFSKIGPLIPAVVLGVNNNEIAVFQQREGHLKIGWKQMNWARPYINNNRRGRSPKKPANIVKRGDIIMTRWYTRQDKNGKPRGQPQWRLAQIPKVEGALVSIRPDDGRLYALVGGFDFYHSKFNRVTQALRQPGSNFKPFIYSAALEYGFSPTSIINDAPKVYRVGNKIWKPENYSNRYYGPTSLRKALIMSRNLPAVRTLDEVGIQPTLTHLSRFGFQRDKIPPTLSIALGSGEVTPLELVRGFAVFANGGYLVEPYFIDHIEDNNGKTVFKANPFRVCRGRGCPESSQKVVKDLAEYFQDQSSDMPSLSDEVSEVTTPRYAPLVVRPQNIWLMNSMLKQVITRGTARRAKVLKRKDLAGKTGTTNDSKDAWFSGFMADVATTAWVGFDHPRSLGKKETGGRAALPMWIDYMREALKEFKPRKRSRPKGLVTVRIDPRTGLRVRPGERGQAETFLTGSVPRRYSPRFVDETLTPAPSDANKSNNSGGGGSSHSPVSPGSLF